MKHPSVRTHSLADWLPETVDQIRSAFLEFRALLPFPVIDFAITGSYARGCAELHSDLDVNIETGSTRERCLAEMKLFPAQWSLAISTLRRRLWADLRLFCDISLEEASVADNPNKRCYRILEGKWYNDLDPLTQDRVIFNTKAGKWQKRKVPPKIGTPKFTFSAIDPETGNAIPGVDPYADIVDEWKAKLGPKMLIVGETEETAYLKVKP